MGLKAKWEQAKEAQRVSKEIRKAKKRKEEQVREDEIRAEAKKLAAELDVSGDTAYRYLKAQKAKELRKAKRAELDQKLKKFSAKLGEMENTPKKEKREPKDMDSLAKEMAKW
jgi:oligoendopeptidase F